MGNQHNGVRYVLVKYVVGASNRTGSVEAVCKVSTEQGERDDVGDAATPIRIARNTKRKTHVEPSAEALFTRVSWAAAAPDLSFYSDVLAVAGKRDGHGLAEPCSKSPTSIFGRRARASSE